MADSGHIHSHIPRNKQSCLASNNPIFCRPRLKCDGTRAETRLRLSAKRTSPFKSAGVSVQSTTGSRGVRISGSNAGYTMFRRSVKGTGYPLYSPVSPSHPRRASPCDHISTGFYRQHQWLMRSASAHFHSVYTLKEWPLVFLYTLSGYIYSNTIQLLQALEVSKTRIPFLLFHFMFIFFLSPRFLYLELRKRDAITPSRGIMNEGSAPSRRHCSLFLR
jgi:hypothetical protein